MPKRTVNPKVNISRLVKAPKILSFDLRSYPTDASSKINEAASLNTLGRDMVDRNRKKRKLNL